MATPRRSPRAATIKALAEKLGLERLAELEAELVRERPVPPRLLERVMRAAEVDENLTPREREVMVLVTSGMTNREIAAELGIVENTVKDHLKRIYLKLEARNRIDAIHAFLERAS
jgi:RNA polymerase sigma factor (sigma-70 family)